MVNYDDEKIGIAFRAIGDPTRMAIVRRLTEGPKSVSELAQPFKMSLPAVSKHIAVLESAGLVFRRKTGRTYMCRLRADRLVDASAWLEQFRACWEKELDSLIRYLNREKSGEDV